MTAPIDQTTQFGDATRAADWSVEASEYESATGATRRAERGATDRVTTLSRALGWFSIGLGVAELVAPETMANLIGMPDRDGDRRLLQGFGLREITSGIGILARPDSAGWVWSRVVGDALDLATLGAAAGSRGANRARLLAAAGAVAGVAALDVYCAARLSRNGGAQTDAGVERERGIEVTEAVTIGRPPEEVYAFWRDFRNLPRFMEHLLAVEVLDDRRSHWTARAPAGGSIEWDAEVVEDRPGERLAWRSLSDAEVDNQGAVTFRPAPGDRGTELLVELSYAPPGGRLGQIVAKLFGEEPGQQVRGDLRRLKQVLETGEVVQSDASIHRGPHPARPSA